MNAILNNPSVRRDTQAPAGPDCPICGAPCNRASHHQPHAYWRCTCCETAHLHPQPSEEFLDDYYEHYHRPSEDGGVYGDFETRTAADFPAKARLVQRHLIEAGRPVSGAPRVLDVGCGKGFFVRELAERGLSAEGIDLSTTGIEAGSLLGVGGLRAGRIEEQSDWAGRFDAVTAWATIEHLPDPRGFIDALSRVLKPGGLLFLDTGLAGDIVERHAPGLIQWYEAPQHLFVYSRSGLETILLERGFEIEAVDPNFERGPLRRAIKYTRNRVLAIGGGVIARAALGRGVFQRMRMETKLPFGSLIFIIARRAARS